MFEHQHKEIQKIIDNAANKPVKELKHKKDIPTVIEYCGRRYILDHGNNK